jgi:3-phosphoshikimate 1-carboxyvinyltransferase
MDITVEKRDRLRGALQVPGDKSIAHRALIFGAMARGVQLVEGIPFSQDVASTAACLRRLGCRVDETAPGCMRVTAGDRRSGQALDAGNSGTTARLLSGLVAGSSIECLIDGDASLRRRPMKRIADPLEQMGARVETAEGGGLPMRIRGAALRGITYELPVASAQVKSAVLIAGLLSSGKTTVVEKAPTRDHTENLFTAMGVPVARGKSSVTVEGGARLEGIRVAVPGDISSAAFFLVAASMLPGSEVRLENVGINPTRTGLLEALRRMGADIRRENVSVQGGEPAADLVVRSSVLHAIEIGGELVPSLIDELPVLAVAATRAEGETVIRDAGELRHKESDRIEAIVTNLRRLGADIEAFEDGFAVRGPCRLEGAAVSSCGDHRIAMAMAVAGLAAEGSTRIENSEVIGISYPGFFVDLRDLAG